MLILFVLLKISLLILSLLISEFVLILEKSMLSKGISTCLSFLFLYFELNPLTKLTLISLSMMPSL